MTNSVAIIGAGPAGIAAAIQCQRQGIDFLLFEQAQVGGLLNNANLVENYPGFPAGIKGRSLVEKFSDQLSNLAVPIINEKVTQVDFSDNIFNIMTDSETRTARYLIMATGTKPVMTELSIPQSLNSRVLYEIINIIEASGHKIVIVGAGDAAFDYALNLVDQNQVIILNRGNNIKCLPLLVERANAHKNIEYLENTSITEIEETPTGQINVACNQTENSFLVDYLIFAIGRVPNDAYLSPKLRAEKDQMIEQRRLFLIGDMANGHYRQTTIAVADGIRAAMHINTVLSGE